MLTGPIQALIDAIWQEDLAKALSILNENPLLLTKENVNAKSNQGRTLLHLAAMQQDTAAITKLLEANAGPIADKQSNTPLHYLLMYSLDLVPLKSIIDLIQNGNHVNASNLERESPVSLAATRRYTHSIFYFLREGADIAPLVLAGINIKDKMQRTTLHWAAFHNNNTVIKQLLDAGANINAVDENGQSPISVAAEYGQLDAIAILIERGAIASIKDTVDQSPALIAELTDHSSAKMMLEKATERQNFLVHSDYSFQDNWTPLEEIVVENEFSRLVL